MQAKRGVDIKKEVRAMVRRDLPDLYQTAKNLIDEPRLAASARARLLSDLFRVAGLFEQEDDGAGKQPSEMSAQELADAIQELDDLAEARRAGSDIFD